MAIKQLFKSRVPSIKFIFAKGKEAIFLNGLFSTDVDDEIAELNQAIKDGNPHVFIDADQLTVDTDITDPLDEVKKKAVAEYIAAQELAAKEAAENAALELADKTKDLGTSDSQLNPSSTTDTGTVAADSNAVAASVKLFVGPKA